MRSRRRLLWTWVVVLGAGALAGVVFRNPIRHLLKDWFETVEVSEGLFQKPEGLAVDSEGNIYVAEKRSCVFSMLDRDGKPISRFQRVEGYRDGQGREAGITRGMNVIAVAPRHVILAASHNIAEIEIQGDQPRLIRIIGSEGKAPGQIDAPEGIARDANGDIYVADQHNERIDVFDKDGKFLRMWDAYEPQRILVSQDRVYVTHNKRNYIACYAKDGRELFRIGREALFPLFVWMGLLSAPVVFAVLAVLKKWRWAIIVPAAILLLAGLGSLGDFIYHHRPGQMRLPDCMVVSPDGKSLYVGDLANSRIQAFDLDGRFKFCFGSFGKRPGEFRNPRQMAFDPAGNLLVADSDNHRLQVFTADGKFIRVIE